MPKRDEPENVPLNFETAAAHVSLDVPVASPHQKAGDFRLALAGCRYECASHVVVCDTGRFVGLVRLEDLLAAPAGAPLESLMDREAPVVAPGVDQEIAAAGPCGMPSPP